MKSLHRWLLLTSSCLAVWLVPIQVQAQHLFKLSHFTVIPHKNTGYSPLHYWAPLTWNVKAYHRGYHRAIGQDYHIPHFESEYSPLPPQGVETPPAPKRPEQLPPPEASK